MKYTYIYIYTYIYLCTYWGQFDLLVLDNKPYKEIYDSVSLFSIKVTLEEELSLDKQRASLSGDQTAVPAP